MSAPWSARRDILIGLACLTLLLGGFGGWATLARITGAVIAEGRVEVAQNRQIVQHLEGGVVSALRVAEGDTVEAGQLLIQLDDSAMASERDIITAQLNEVIARRARLEAERDGRTTIDMPVRDAALQGGGADIAPMLALQSRLLDARRITREGARAQLEKRGAQIADQIAGLAAQRRSLSTQAALIAREKASQTILRNKGLTQESRLLAIQREEARLAGALGEVAAQIAQAEGRGTEITLEMLRLDAAYREEAITALDPLQARELELRARREALARRMHALSIGAPVRGVVHGLQVFAPGAVLRPAQPLLHIVPQDSPVIISARLRNTDIDLVHAGQPVRIRLPALDQQTTPEMDGRIARISPDIFIDEVTGQSHYTLRIIQTGERPPGAELLPGMPAQILIRTGDRSPLSLLVKPLTDYFARALRG
ncbi:HlyD family secretion protein [Roseovarius nanhaiticus]|uniref:Membrane fusion protein (MFP) family protein n=1 Tax=Roseovarius nanhaiticus TaxID=573024 RepID=A0A1N7EL95_9RHOB|nr:HlyD family type I secretion periplasmic adaptor subunit [Roseovarius nanhaiticus]SEK72148.1 HlyD family secretion protein [Roseovarius nanhaiticus]SIR88883.1 HlyD family secretion protein [Roseovarius nanhaiticus]